MSFKQKIFDFYNLTTDEYDLLTKEVSFSDLPPPSQFSDMEKASERIFQAINNNEKIVVYGDYDADGVMATSILVATLKRLGANVGYYLPSRYIDGYGLNIERVNQFGELGYNLIITVDNGIAQIEAVKKANSLGIDVIISDHHEPLETLPPALAILHPTVSNYGEIISCGAYIAFMLAWALLKAPDEYYATLAMVATVADLMPLVGYNRDIVKIGLKLLNKHKYSQLTLLANEAVITEETVGFLIAPKINAVGRVLEGVEINNLIRYFESEDANLINQLARWINQVNEQRKTTMNLAFAKGEKDVDTSKSAIVTITEEKEGLIGLLASRYVEKYEKVSVVFCPHASDETLLKGSARSKPGFSITKAFQSLSHLLEAYGGHEGAGGLTIKKSNFAAFKQGFEQLALKYEFIEVKEQLIPLEIEEISFPNFNFLNALSPFGIGFPAPKFLLSKINPHKLNWSNNNKHIVSNISKEVRITGWNINQNEFLAANLVDLSGKLLLNTWRGFTSIVFNIESYEPSDE